MIKVPAWWPPNVGDKLRHFTLHTDHETGGMKQVHALNHVVSVFEWEGDTMATVAEWFPTRRRWNYETIHGWLMIGQYWPDQHDPPAEHTRCSACEYELPHRYPIATPSLPHRYLMLSPGSANIEA